MNPAEIKTFLESFSDKSRAVVIVDFGNVDKWEKNLGWRVGIQELGRLVKNFAQGNKVLRRFYYGSDYGSRERSTTLSPWSQGVLDRADMNRFEVVTKPVKYIHDSSKTSGFEKKCDFDVEMAVDLVRMRDDYDHIILFSGDGDLVYALRYLRDAFGKSSYVFGARAAMSDGKSSMPLRTGRSNACCMPTIFVFAWIWIGFVTVIKHQRPALRRVSIKVR